MKGKGLLAVVLLLSTSACAPEIVTRPEVRAGVVAKTGQTVVLYAGEARDSARLFCVGDVLVAYRGAENSKPVGRVRVTGYSGEHHISGVVMEGSVVKGDIVKKGSVACTVQSAPAAGLEEQGIEPAKTK